MKKIAILLVVLGLMTGVSAQKEGNIWYFGNHAGMDFNSGSPVLLGMGQTNSYDNSSTVSDSNGDLLFYTDGSTVWNKTHAIMNKGSGLMGTPFGGQCALIVPQPESTLYYIFTVDNFAGSNGFRYSVVDISLQSGMGSVIVKNVLLFNPTPEKIDAIYNDRDNTYWVMAHSWGSNYFYCYKLTHQGLNVTPIISSCGSIHSGGNPIGYNAMGQMTFSSDGAKLVSTLYSDGKIEIFDFDMHTGLLSNTNTITGYPNVLGAAFSPDASKLYITIWKTSMVWQFDLSSDSLPLIIASASVVGMATSTNGQYAAGYMQLAPDGKIYIARYDMHYLAVINNPNQAGGACSFVNNGFSLGAYYSSAGLSRVPVRSITINVDDFMAGDSPITLYPNPNNGSFNILFPADYHKVVLHLNVYNLLGQKCFEQNMISANVCSISLPSNIKGLLSVEIICENKILFQGKLVVGD